MHRAFWGGTWKSISKAAQDYLRAGAMQAPPQPVPAIADPAGWRTYISEGDKVLPAEMILKMPDIDVDVETRKIGSATCYIATPRGISEADRRKAHLSIFWFPVDQRAGISLLR